MDTIQIEAHQMAAWIRQDVSSCFSGKFSLSDDSADFIWPKQSEVLQILNSKKTLYRLWKTQSHWCWTYTPKDV